MVFAVFRRTGIKAFALGQFRNGDQMPIVGMDAAGPNKADEVQGVIAVLGLLAQLKKNGPAEEATAGDRLVDPRQILQNRLARAQVQVADFGVAHLAFRQTDKLLGRLQRTGPISWGMPFSVNLTLRQVGLVLFLAGIGTKAGDGFAGTVERGGWALMAVGAGITLVTTILVLGVGSRLLRLSYPAVMGLMSGIQTQPACLAYANEHGASDAPNVWYASVYPVSMIAKIIMAQLLVSRLM